MFNENILTYGIHPAEVVVALIFIWAAYIFISIRNDVVKTSLFRKEHYIYWVDAMIFFALQQVFDVMDNIEGFRVFNYLEHAAFLIGSVLLVFAIYRSFKEYGNGREVKE